MNQSTNRFKTNESFSKQISEQDEHSSNSDRDELLPDMQQQSVPSHDSSAQDLCTKSIEKIDRFATYTQSYFVEEADLLGQEASKMLKRIRILRKDIDDCEALQRKELATLIIKSYVRTGDNPEGFLDKDVIMPSRLYDRDKLFSCLGSFEKEYQELLKKAEIAKKGLS